MVLPVGFLASLGERFIKPTVADQIFRARPLQKRLYKNKMNYPGGTSLDIPILYQSEPNVQAITGTDLIPLTIGAPITSARYLMKRYTAQLVLPREQILINSGPPQVINLISTRRRSLEMTLDDVLGGDAINSSGTGAQVRNMEGIANIVDNVTSTGSIGPADVPQWASSVQTSAQTIASNMFPIQQGFGAVTIGSDMPTLALTTQTILNAMWQDGQQIQRFVDEGALLAGFTALGFNQRPVVVDSGIPANNFYWLNERYLEQHVHSDDNFHTIFIETVPDQDISVWRISVTLAITTDNRRMHFKHTNLLTT